MGETYYYETATGHDLQRDPLKAIIAPRPIGWISSLSPEGHANLAPYSFFNMFHENPAIIGFSSVSYKDSVRNVEATGEFAFNLATRPLAEAVNISSHPFPPEADEFEQAGIAKAPCRLIRPPRVAASPVTMECRLSQIIRLTNAGGDPLDGWMVLGEVVAVHIDRSLLVEGRFDTGAARTIMRAGYAADYWEIGADGLFRMPRPRALPGTPR